MHQYERCDETVAYELTLCDRSHACMHGTALTNVLVGARLPEGLL